MSNEKELSNTSYTNKDFQSIYPELLDLVKKLTNKWDPSLSNESDPGVVLLKLNALIADKNNYNIDKNVLECFPTTVTQEGNARRLYDSLGYKMHWYRSATTEIGFQLKSKENISAFYVPIPQFTMITDSNNSEFVYTTLKDVNLSTSANEMSVNHYVQCIEGTIKTLSINGSESLTLDNLDSNLRLYFPETNVAENGIFIQTNEDISWTNWTKVDNIASYPLGQQVYEFGVLPNSNTCYIEFPEDVATLIQRSNTFQVKYILSTGTKGNIKSRSIDSFLDNITLDYENPQTGEITPQVLNDQIRIIQLSGTLNGEDPETVSDAYRNYKKTVGTFNTLVTKRDYQNFVNSAQVGTDYLASNCVVSDRTNDLNATLKVQSWSPNFNTENTLVLKDDDGRLLLNAFNIVVYALNAGDGTYDSTFEPNVDGYVKSLLLSMIGDVKAIEHDIMAPNEFDGLIKSFFYIYKNLYALKGQIVTYEKVTKAEAKEIEQAVRDALEQNYDARHVTFGEEPDYADLIDTIQNADSRIKTVALDVPKYQIYNVANAGTDNSGAYVFNTLTARQKLTVVAKMILAGKVQLFDFDDSFNYEFGIENYTNINDNVEDSKQAAGADCQLKSITTETKIALKTTDYTLKDNEVIQLYAPNFIVTKEYSSAVHYRYYKNSSETEAVINANEDHMLSANEALWLYYIDATNNQPVKVKLSSGSIVNSSITLTASVSDNFDVFDSDPNKWSVLTTGQSIKVKEIVVSTIPAKTSKVYFILNNAENRLQLSTENRIKVLQEGEYFFYTNENTDELLIYGSGTQLSLPEDYSGDNLDVSIPGIVDYDALQESDLQNLDWVQLPTDILATELDIISIGKGAKIRFDSYEGDFKISNVAKELPEGGNVTITDPNGETIKVYDYPTSEGNKRYLIQSRLALNTTFDSPQKLIADDDSKQTISLNFVALDANGNEDANKIIDSYVVDPTKTSNEVWITFNNAVILSGGIEQNASVLTDTSLGEYSLVAYSFTKANDFNIEREKGVIKVSGLSPELTNKKSKVYPFTFTQNSNLSSETPCWLIQVYFTKSTGSAKVSFNTFTDNNYGTAVKLQNYPKTIEDFDKSGSYILAVPNDKTYHGFQIVFEGDVTNSDLVTIGNINRVNGLNSNEIDVISDPDLNTYSRFDEFKINDDFKVDGDGDREKYTIFEEIEELIKASSNPDVQFDYTYRVPESEKVLQPTASSSYWNPNHLINEYTIPQIDFSKTKIVVNPYSIQ